MKIRISTLDDQYTYTTVLLSCVHKKKGRNEAKQITRKKKRKERKVLRGDVCVGEWRGTGVNEEGRRKWEGEKERRRRRGRGGEEDGRKRKEEEHKWECGEDVERGGKREWEED